MKIKEVAQLTDLPESTIRFYEEEGLISPEKEYMNGRYYRSYSEDDVHLLRTIGTLRKARFSMDEIRSMGSDPKSIEDICAQCCLRLREEVSALREISSTLSSLTADSIGSMFSLADALSEKTKNVELPARDIQVNFARFDSEQWDEPDPEPDPGTELIDRTNEKINRIMGAQPAEYVYSTGMFSNASPGKRMAMDEFSNVKNMGFESGYPTYMTEEKEYKTWARVLRIICGVVVGLFCAALMLMALLLYNDGSLGFMYRVTLNIVRRWYLFSLIPAAVFALATIFGQKKE